MPDCSVASMPESIPESMPGHDAATGAQDGAVARGGLALLRPLRHRDFRLLWFGASATLLGDGVYLVALAWQALALRRGPGGLALLGVCATLPQLLCVVFGGVISDRFDRRRVLLVADVARAVAVGASPRRAGRAAAAVAAGGAQRRVRRGCGVRGAGVRRDHPRLVRTTTLEEANALDQFLRPTMLRLAGPAVGGLLVAARRRGRGVPARRGDLRLLRGLPAADAVPGAVPRTRASRQRC